MNCDQKKYTDTQHRIASFIIIRKSSMSMDFTADYLENSRNEKIITGNYHIDTSIEYNEFIAHRHDQSIYSLLTKKLNLQGFRDPSQYGNIYIEKYPNSNYGQIIQHNRVQSIPKINLLELPKKALRKLLKIGKVAL